MTVMGETSDPKEPLLAQPPLQSQPPLLDPPPTPPPPFSQPHPNPIQSATCYGIPASRATTTTIVQEHYFPEPPAYVLVPVYPRPGPGPAPRPRPRPRRCCGCFRYCCSFVSSSTLLSGAFLVVLLLSTAFFVWPSDPELTIVNLSLDSIRVKQSPELSITVSMDVGLMIRNPDFFGLDYRHIVVSISYRGRNLGSVTADGGHIRARGVSYLHAKLKLDGIRVISEAFYLIEDLARGSLPLDTVTEIDGKMHLFFLDVSVQGKLSCALNVNPETQKILHQNCYPE